MKTVTRAASSGFCFGVRRAVELAEKLGKDGVNAVTLGPIIHNTHVVEYLKSLGVSCVDSVDEIPDGATAIIRSHGVAASVTDELKRRNIPFVDATCPYVEKIHKIVRENENDGRQVIVIGSKTHPEVCGIAGQCKNALVFESEKDINDYISDNPKFNEMPVSIVAQTTIGRNFWNNCIKILKKQCTNCKIFDTICFATGKRQTEAGKLAEVSDAMVVIGDRTSSNTRGLVHICQNGCQNVFHIEHLDELPVDEICGFDHVGITAGASTPDWIIKEVENKMSEQITNENINAEGMSFAEMLEASFKTLNTGDKVTGVVTGITPTEVYVDLGAKHAGFIPVAEISDDPSVKAEEIFKIGDEVEVYVVRVNDVEGVVTLSKRRLDAMKSWDDIEAARQDETVVEGVVIDENRGGIIVSVKGARVFVPASQTGLPRDAELSQMMKKKVSLRITEVNRPRKRIVGSISKVLRAERHAAAEKVWSEIEVGKAYKGVVKSLTSYGAFVDIGGVDGMVHVSEMSWSRIGHPSEMFKVGDVVDVFVIALDAEKKKISLGYKKAEDNPWVKFTTSCKLDDVVDAKIVKLMPFGAFAEILPGVDGLIHISQISNTRIATPKDVLSEGQTVQVKIIGIDEENKKISLSMRALIEGEEVAAEAEAVEGEDEIVASVGDGETILPAEDAE